jgi:hypothetical protein
MFFLHADSEVVGENTRYCKYIAVYPRKALFLNLNCLFSVSHVVSRAPPFCLTLCTGLLVPGTIPYAT